MTTDIRLIHVASSTTYYLNNTTAAPGTNGVAAGGALTGGATTPLGILNDNWTMRGPQPIDIYAGGPPFAHGAQLQYEDFGDTQQSIPFSIVASSHDNLAAILRQLRQVLFGAAFSPAGVLLCYKPSAATSAAYWIVKAGYIVERADEVNPSEGFYDYVEADMVLTLSPFGGRLTSGETLINAQSVTNAGASDNNVEVFGSGSGDMIYAGSPVNYDLAFSANCSEVWMASVAAHIYNTGVSGAVSTTSTTPVAGTASGSISAASVAASNRLKIRVLIRLTGTPTATFRIGAQLQTSSGAAVLWQSPYVAPRSGVTNTVIDLGYATGEFFRNNNTTVGSFVVRPLYYSSDGTTATATIASVEVLYYYDFYKVQAANSDSMSNLQISQFREVSGYAALPITPPGLRGTRSSIDRVMVAAGTPPRYFSGSSLWLCWFDSSTLGEHTNTRTLTLTATHAPLYTTARGAG